MSENSSEHLVKQFNKQFGEGIVHTGDQVHECPRYSTGVFSMDLSLGGGLPKGHMTQIYGMQDSGKSLLAYKIIATHQKQYPDQKCVLIDIEDNFEKEWGLAIGIDVENLLIVNPDHTAQAIDMAEGLIHAEDVGLVVIDSLGAMIGQNELESSAEKMAVGGNALLIGKMCRKLRTGQSKIRRLEGRYPSVLCINQVRTKIGVMYGSDEHLPGGKTPQFAINCSIRLYGKLVLDKKVHDAIPVRIETSAQIVKYKFPITSKAFKYDIVVYPHNGQRVGDCYEWNTVSHFLKDLGYLKKAEKGVGYTCFGNTYKTISELKDRALKNFKFYTKLKDVITQTVLKKDKIIYEPVPKKTTKKSNRKVRA